MIRRHRPRRCPGPGRKLPRMISVFARMPGPHAGVPHVAGWVVCQVCGDRHVTVVPARRALDGTECPRCGCDACASSGAN